MKKTFQMSHPKIKRPRLVEAIKHEVKKYLKRERRKELPLKVDFWDFDCRYGADEDSAQVIHVAEINQYISQAETDGLESFYLEILAKPGIRTKKPLAVKQAELAAATEAKTSEATSFAPNDQEGE